MKESECLVSLHAKYSLLFRLDIIKGGITNLCSARKSPTGGHFGPDSLQSTLGRDLFAYPLTGIIQTKMKITQGVTRWLRRSREKDMTTFKENILSDPTSDGNVSEFDQIAPIAPPEPPSYQTFTEIARGPINLPVDNDSLTQRCPTCGGTGKLTKGQLNLFCTYFMWFILRTIEMLGKSLCFGQ